MDIKDLYILQSEMEGRLSYEEEPEIELIEDKLKEVLGFEFVDKYICLKNSRENKVCRDSFESGFRTAINLILDAKNPVINRRG